MPIWQQKSFYNQEIMNTDNIYILGDVHGEFNRLKSKIKEIDIRNCLILQVGDQGVGFQPNFEKEYRFCKDLNDFLAHRNIELFATRGNHDRPDYFINDYNLLNFSHFKLISDYTTMNINNEKFLFVGGAISIDRIYRKEGSSYWKDEVFILDETKAEECDVLITHSAPRWLGPFNKYGIASWCEKDPALWDDCVKERVAHDRLLEICKPKKHYCGHFHQSCINTVDGCSSRILDIMEIVEHRPTNKN